MTVDPYGPVHPLLQTGRLTIAVQFTYFNVLKITVLLFGRDARFYLSDQLVEQMVGRLDGDRILRKRARRNENCEEND